MLKLNRNISALILAVALALVLITPELLSGLHLAHDHHHDHTHCEICVQISVLMTTRNHALSVATAPLFTVALLLLVLSLGGKATQISMETLVSLNMKQTN